MDRQSYLNWCAKIDNAQIDQPFEGDFETSIVRHADSGKWFAALLSHEGRRMVNLKCDPIEAEFLKSVYSGIESAYHMNKTHWISVYFDTDVPDELFCRLTMLSFQLTKKKPRKRG